MTKKLLLSVAMVSFMGMSMYAQEEEPITMPEGIEPLVFVDTEGHEVYVAINGKYAYFQGLSTRYPEFTVRADYNGSVAYIPQWQFVECYGNTYDIYTRMNIMDYNEEDVLEFYPAPADYMYPLNINLETGIINCPKDDAFTLFGFSTYVNGNWEWVDYRQNVYLKLYVDNTGTPANPTNLEVEKYDGDDFYSVMFTLPLTATNGNPLALYDTYYTIYVNGEEYTFEPDEEAGIYTGVPYPLTEMPAYFSNDNDIVTNGEGHLVGIYVDNLESVSVQTIYRYNDEITKSEIVTWNNAGVETIGATEVVGVEYFDLNGRKVVNPERGIYIMKERLSNGTSKSVKIAR